MGIKLLDLLFILPLLNFLFNFSIKYTVNSTVSRLIFKVFFISRQNTIFELSKFFETVKSAYLSDLHRNTTKMTGGIG